MSKGIRTCQRDVTHYGQERVGHQDSRTCASFLHPHQMVLNIRGEKKERESEWGKSEKHRALILHITVLLNQTPRITSPCACICGSIFHRLR